MALSSWLPTIEINPIVHPPTSAVVWLHGLGADGSDFVPIVERLASPLRAETRFIFPHAAKRPITLNGGAVMRGWYDIVDRALERDVDHVGIKASCMEVQALLRREIERGVAPHKLAVVGFSQGGVIALCAGLSFAEPLAGVVGLSTYLPDPDYLLSSDVVQASVPVFLAHGFHDGIVPWPLSGTMKQALEDRGLSVELHGYAMAHGVIESEISDLSAFLRHRLQLPIEGPCG